MVATSLKVEFPMRQAMLKVTKTKKAIVGMEVRCWEESHEVPVLV